ncbi:MAG: polysaccharide deacetylase family protein [Chloroflexi bacterium]|nr:polysaccharide deacetylase family protein [Chloroflexota bacterium]
MGYLEHVRTSKGLSTAWRRARALVQQVGPTTQRMNRTLDAYLSLLDAFHIHPTFPTPAAVVHAHPSTTRELRSRGVEIAVHGYHHVDYTTLSPAEQEVHIEKAVTYFREQGLPLIGFRAPYLRWNTSLLDVLARHRFVYDSSLSVYWDVVDMPIPPDAHARLQRVVHFYRAQDAASEPVLPSWHGNLLLLPVSLPDDEILVDRLGLSGEAVGRVWSRILARTHEQGELFVLQLHPERFGACRDGLAHLLQEAQALSPPVWIAPLEEIARWWRSRTQLSLTLRAAGPHTWELAIPNAQRVGLLVRGVRTEPASTQWMGEWQWVSHPRVRIHSPARPTVGLGPQVPPDLARYVRDLGYLTEPVTAEHVIVLEESEGDAAARARVRAQLEESRVPLIRVNPWPGNSRSALAVTGDLDVLTWWDFLARLFLA